MIRVRLPELLAGRTIGGRKATAYAVAKASDGRVLARSLYTLIGRHGRGRLIDARLLETLLDLWPDLTVNDLLQRVPDDWQPPKAPKAAKRR